jgi:hypothetical protein
MQIISWALLYDDLFTIKGKQLECRLEIEVPETYWDRESIGAEESLDSLLVDYTPPMVAFDRTNPLEIMVALVTQLGEQHKQFMDTYGEYIRRAFAGLTLSSRAASIDDAGFLQSTLDEFLSDNVDEPLNGS